MKKVNFGIMQKLLFKLGGNDISRDSSSSQEKGKFIERNKMSGSGLLYNLPLRVALPPLSESIDCNMNIMDMDKKLSKELNISADNSDIHKTGVTSSNSMEKKPSNNEETDGSISMTSSEKQEWSVTLYDVDRKGNVSEEDLARLVTMLYKAAGSSITVPQEGSGTKKIKLRLSVAPDQNHTKVFIQKPSKSSEDNATQQQSTPLSSTKKEKKHKERHKYSSSPQTATVTLQATKQTMSPVQDTGKENVESSKLLGRSHSHTKAHSHRKRNKKRSSRTQSAEKSTVKSECRKATDGPVMENMDRRQYYKDLVGIENETLQNLELSEEKSNRLNLTAPASLLMNFAESQGNSVNSDPIKCEKSQTVYLPPQSGKDKDKSGGGNKLGKQVHFEGHKGYVNNGFISSHTHHHHHGSKHSRSKSSGHKSRPKSCPVGDERNNLDNVTVEQFIDGFNEDNENPSKVYNVYLNSTPNPAAKSLPHRSNTTPSKPIRETETVSPHHMRRHRNREQEYNRSMKQVAEWIQRQHTWVASPNIAAPEPVVLQHEHHHIHHHHYHFYHYYET